MRSKTSCFNGALFKKNLTRFAPAWGFYTLCLILGTLLLYNNGGTAKQYHFAANMMEMTQIMTVVNLFYAPIVAQLLFGDLYNSRMCNALHAMPVRRESIYFTNLISGLLFSLVPTMVMAAVSIPLMASSCFTNAWQIPLYVFAATNLEFVCFFGIAVFSILCAGNRLGMIVIYGLINFLASIAYWLIDTVYTPMLYGVVTPHTLAEILTPVLYLGGNAYLSFPNLSEMIEKYNYNWNIAAAEFTLTENWSILFAYAGVGIAFALVSLLLYRKRHLECAGDALAFRTLEPVFQILVALVTAAGAQFFLYMFLNIEEQNYLFLAAGLAVGWFGCRMLIERSARVFRIKNWLGLAAVSIGLAASLFATHLDIFGIETWMPDLQDIESVYFSTSQANGRDLTEESDIARMLSMQEEALAGRLENEGPYVVGLDGTWVYNIDTNSALIGKEQSEITDCRYVFSVRIIYTLKSGKEVRRDYNLWADGPSGDTAREFMSDWDNCVNARYWDKENRVENLLPDLRSMGISGIPDMEKPDRALVEGLIEAIKLDCEAGTMAQNLYLHTGHFVRQTPNDRGIYPTTPYVTIYLDSNSRNWYIEIFPDSEHTVKYLRDHDLLIYDIAENNLHYN